jgi:hypothetical protein
MARVDSPTALRTDVQNTIDGANPGDTIVVPDSAGVSWAGGITISGKTLEGAGTGITNLDNITTTSGTCLKAGCQVRIAHIVLAVDRGYEPEAA